MPSTKPPRLGVADVVRQLPAQDARAELARAADDAAAATRARSASNSSRLPRPGEHVALAARVRDRELAQARLGLAGVHQRLQQAAVDVVGDRLAVEEPDRDRVGAGVGGAAVGSASAS